LNWRLKLSNWLSNGALEKYQRQAEIAQGKLKQHEMRIDSLSAQLKQSQTDIERFEAQLKISEGFQVELGETQIELHSVKTQAQRCQQELKIARERLEAIETQHRQATAELSESKNWLKQVRQSIKVVEIKKLLPKEEFDTLWGFGLGSPRANTAIDGGSVAIKGWVLGRKSVVSRVQITFQQQPILNATLGQSRPTVSQQYPDIPGAGNSGFEANLAVIGIPSEIELAIEAVLENEKVIPLCAIRLQKSH
jgi:hypothetical protein